VLGSSNTFGAGGFDILAVRTDVSGQYQGNLSDFAIGGGGNDFSVYARKVLTTPTGGFLVAGATLPKPGGGDSDAVLLSLDADGRQNGLGVYGVPSGDDIAFFARRTNDFTYQLAGIKGTLTFTNPVEFNVSSGVFWAIDIDSATLLINPP
jgi:hypothetical protein